MTDTTVKRKIASIKALFHYFEYRDLIERNPFSKIQVKFREPVLLPKTIPLHTVETFLSTIYKQLSDAKTDYKKRNALRDAAVIELLFATGMRISELCSLNEKSVNLYDRTILIYGKGSKERKVQIGNDDVINVLKKYKKNFEIEIKIGNILNLSLMSSLFILLGIFATSLISISYIFSFSYPSIMIGISL